jgi:benzoyl-CoA reductase/2-hydroxyglutaryl-CoA dehydratase subunit BcrC/BadD/HgdB
MASEIETGTKYIPEMSEKEVAELGGSIKASSLKVIEDNIQRMKKAWKNRPEAMEYFDEISNLFGRREKEIREQKEAGKKVIGYSCIFAPIELILAADAIPVRIGSGWYDTAKLGDRIMPVEICPVIRSTVGAKMVSLSPFLELSDAIVMPLTCDGRTKLSEMLSDFKPIWHMNPPRVKDDPHTAGMWKEEIQVVKDRIEKLTGKKQ